MAKKHAFPAWNKAIPYPACTYDPALHREFGEMYITQTRSPSEDLLENKMFCPVSLGQKMGEIVEGSQAERLIIAACLSEEAGFKMV